MPPRHLTLPPAATAAAREAMQSFYCQLCQKGYTRMNEYEAHLSSYDHTHKQRLKDMKAMVRDPNAAARARRQEAKADGVISIKLGEGSAASASGNANAASNSSNAGGFKKGGFKKTGFKAAFPAAGGGSAAAGEKKDDAAPGATRRDDTSGQAVSKDEYLESDTEDEGYEVYDPRYPTD